jgi:hypothetical protein
LTSLFRLQHVLTKDRRQSINLSICVLLENKLMFLEFFRPEGTQTY